MIVQNSKGSGPGRLPEWLADEGIEPVVVAGPDLPPSARMDGLVILGGPFMPDDVVAAPHLPRARALVDGALTDGLPVFGICLGAQLLALAAGGSVTARSGETERGSCPVRLLAAADDDPLFAGLTNYDELRMIQNHHDSITALPPGAVHLATSDACRVQAFRVGSTAWGVQFHPEASAEKLADWDESKLAAEGFDLSALRARASADAETNTEQARALVGAFAKVVHEAGG
jgi:GMP synthase-like glutamine amidotransferase